jgi:hypothetical protein
MIIWGKMIMHVHNLFCVGFIGYAATLAPFYPAVEVRYNHELSHTDAPTTTYSLFNSPPIIAQRTAYIPTWVSGRLNLNPITPSSDPF